MIVIAELNLSGTYRLLRVRAMGGIVFRRREMCASVVRFVAVSKLTHDEKIDTAIEDAPNTPNVANERWAGW